MGIGIYLKEIGRGKDGARSLSRAQAADLMGQVLDASVTDLEIGAFCLAMRVKGETPQETRGYEGFFHVHHFNGSIEETVLELIIRDHSASKFKKRKELIHTITKKFNKKHKNASGGFVHKYHNSIFFFF
jgi:di/tripeptidase